MAKLLDLINRQHAGGHHPVFFVTGSTGYIGSHLVDSLMSHNLPVVIIPRKGVEPPRVSLPAKSLKRWNSVSDLTAQLQRFDQKILINLAGHFVANHQSLDIEALLTGNLVHPVEMFEAFASSGCVGIVNIGTSWEYDRDGSERPKNLYAAMKRANSKIFEWYVSNRLFVGLELKLNDTFGGMDRRRKLMPLIKASLETGEKLQLRSRLQKMNLLYIEDVITGIMSATCHLLEYQNQDLPQFSLFADETVTIEQLVVRIEEITGKQDLLCLPSKEVSEDPFKEICYQRPGPPGWSPQVSLNKGLSQYLSC